MPDPGSVGGDPVALLNDAGRLAALRRTALGPEADPAFDRVARMVRRQLGCDVALVSLVDADRQFFPGQVGLGGSWALCRETPLSHSFCQHVVVSAEPLVIEDARLDPRLRSNLAIPDLGVVGYAGMPITDEAGNVLGSLCAITEQPRAWSEADLDALEDLAAACSSEVRLRIGAVTARATLNRLTLLAEVTRALGTLDGDVALARLTRLMVPALADWCTAGLVDEAGRVRVTVSRHADPGRAADLEAFGREQAQVVDAAAPTRLALRTGEALVLDDPETLLGSGGEETM